MHQPSLWRNAQNGQITIQVMVFGTIGVMMIAGFALWADVNIKAAYRSLNKGVAFTAAEAGIEYYRWHLAHAPADYWDGHGVTSTGPYVHTYYDKNGNALGSFSLAITPPPNGSTIVTVQSTGKTNADASIDKVIRVKLGKPSFAKYAWVLNDFVNFGVGAEVFGPIHSNTGIHFDGVVHNLITSAVYSYDDPDHSEPGADPLEFGVHTHVPPVDPLPPAAVPVRPDVFQAGRKFPVAPVDFVGIAQDLSDIKANAQAAGFYAPSSTKRGYELTLNTNHTFTLRRVNTTTTQSGCSSEPWGVGTTLLLGTYPMPANGLIFIEDNLWVKGKINGDRLTIASGRFPDNAATRTSIIFNSSTLYTNYNGTDVLGFVSQKDINIGLKSEDSLRVDGALIAQNGRIGRLSYPEANCGVTRSRTLFTSDGMLGTNQRSAFWYSAANGYQSRVYIYDSNLLYAPPPNFPLTTDDYQQASWEELK